MEIKFTPEKLTKNCVKFQEVLEDEMSIPAVGVIYVNKQVLKNNNWSNGTITIHISFE